MTYTVSSFFRARFFYVHFPEEYLFLSENHKENSYLQYYAEEVTD